MEASGGSDPAAQPQLSPEEEEMRQRLEEEMARVSMDDFVLQSLAGILNLAARRIVKDDERDLEQAQLGIELCRRATELLPDKHREALTSALSELQMLYVQHSGDGADAGAAPGAGAGPAAPGPGPARPESGQRPGGLWTPGS
ncbi:MAG: hypothetical protein ACR2NA_04345 [Solirubrobacterales bacterium]